MIHTEALLHTRFAEKRTTGEWFVLDQADLDWIVEQFPGSAEEERRLEEGTSRKG